MYITLEFSNNFNTVATYLGRPERKFSGTFIFVDYGIV